MKNSLKDNRYTTADNKTSKQSEKPLKPSTEAWMLQTLQHGKRMSQDENYRQLVAKSLS